MESGHTFVKCANKDVKHDMQIVENKIIAVHKGNVCTIVRYTYPHLDSTNLFVEEGIITELYYIELHGWWYAHDLK